MTQLEDREQQASICRLLLYYLNAPLADHCLLHGVIPARDAVRVAVRVGSDDDADTILYELPNDAVAPHYVPGILRSVLGGTQLYSSDDVTEIMGMSTFRIHPERIVPDPEPEQGQALTVLRALADPGTDDNPFLIGFLLHGPGRLRLYVLAEDDVRIIGVDVLPADASTALIASLPALLDEEQYQRPASDDPHCDVLVDLTDW